MVPAPPRQPISRFVYCLSSRCQAEGRSGGGRILPGIDFSFSDMEKTLIYRHTSHSEGEKQPSRPQSNVFPAEVACSCFVGFFFCFPLHSRRSAVSGFRKSWRTRARELLTYCLVCVAFGLNWQEENFGTFERSSSSYDVLASLVSAMRLHPSCLFG